jgi:iron(III) transport system substrate-binding protein
MSGSFLHSRLAIMKKNPVFKILIVIVLLSTMLTGCNSNARQKQVIVYTAVDQVFSEPVLEEFERLTGIQVLPVYDVEAAKTTGLVNRLIAESNRPKADVFWSNECAQMIILKEKSVLAPYNSPSAQDIPEQYRDPEYHWTGFGARARVIIVNTELVTEEQYPSSIYDLLLPAWKNEVGIAQPLFGTTSSHAAALFVELGNAEAQSYFTALLANGVHIVDGNSVVRDMVVSSELKCGLTDTDDALVAIEEGKSVTMIFPDQQGIGTLLIPNTVGLINGAPHPDEARQFIDYLLSKDVEEALANCPSRQIPLRDGVPVPEILSLYDELRFMAISPQDIANEMSESSVWLQQYFIR